VRRALLLACLLTASWGCGDRREAPPAGPWQRVDLTQEPPASGADGIQARSLPLGVLASPPRQAAHWDGRGALVRGLAQTPGTAVTWRLRLGSEPALTFRALGGPPHGRRKVAVLARGAATVVYEQDTTPPGLPAAARSEIDLSAYAGQEIDLRLEASAGEPATAKVTWGSPEVVWRGEPVASPAAPPSRPNILLVGLDAVRADAVGPRAGGPSLTPALDALAAESDVWTAAYSCFNVTNPSFASIFTGLYGKHHGAYELSPPGLGPEHATLAELLAGAGYRTAAVVSARFLGAPESGIVQGFEKVRRPEDGTFAAENAVGIAMQQIADRAEPFFLFLHLYDAHTPHTPPEPFAGGRRPAATPGMGAVEAWAPFRGPGPAAYDDTQLGGARALYDGEVAYIDRELGRLLDFLRSRGLLERTLVAVVSDHGENLNEHGITYRHSGLFESTTHVPMMIRWPGPTRPGRRFSGLVQTIDLFPTLLGAAGLQAPAQDGLDLTDLFAAGRNGRRVVFAEHFARQGAMVRTADYRLTILLGMPFLADGIYFYDTTADPAELENLAGSGLAEEAELRRILTAWLADAGPQGQRGSSPLTPEAERELRALGYLP
jgi:arylsulfatase A-like enzyme